MKKALILALLVSILAGIYFFTAGKKEFFYNGTAQAPETDVSSRATGIIKKYYVDEGDEVKKGDVLAEIESPDIELAYDIALKDYNRAEKLLKTATIAQQQYDAAKYKYEDAKTRLSWTKIISHMDGAVIYKFCQDGEFVSAGAKLLTISNNRDIDVNVYAEYETLSKIHTGMTVKGFLPEMKNKEFEGKIVFINDKSEFTPKNAITRKERSRLVYRVKIKFSNEQNILKSGMTLEVKLPD